MDCASAGGNSFATLKLADGSLIAFWSGGTSFIIVDINGYKPPNTYGRDTFWFMFDSQKVYPWSLIANPAVNVGSNCDKTKATYAENNGRECTALVLRNENLDYLRCSDLNWAAKTTCN